MPFYHPDSHLAVQVVDLLDHVPMEDRTPKAIFTSTCSARLPVPDKTASPHPAPYYSPDGGIDCTQRQRCDLRSASVLVVFWWLPVSTCARSTGNPARCPTSKHFPPRHVSRLRFDNTCCASQHEHGCCMALKTPTSVIRIRWQKIMPVTKEKYSSSSQSAFADHGLREHRQRPAGYRQTKKTELLFLPCFCVCSNPVVGAIIVPDGVLFGSSNAHNNCGNAG